MNTKRHISQLFILLVSFSILFLTQQVQSRCTPIITSPNTIPTSSYRCSFGSGNFNNTCTNINLLVDQLLSKPSCSSDAECSLSGAEASFLRLNMKCLSNKCRFVQRENGADCTLGSQCANGVCRNGICSFASVGEACNSTLKCDTSIHYCSPLENICRERGIVGQSCIGSLNGVVDCVDNAFCNPLTNVCEGLKSVNQDCLKNSQCTGDTYCNPTTSKCEPALRAGSNCRSNTDCVVPLYCENYNNATVLANNGFGVCKERIPTGQGNCTVNDQCASLKCNFNTTVCIKENTYNQECTRYYSDPNKWAQSTCDFKGACLPVRGTNTYRCKAIFEGREGDSCELNKHCADHHYCSNRVCRYNPSCTTDADCGVSGSGVGSMDYTGPVTCNCQNATGIAMMGQANTTDWTQMNGTCSGNMDGCRTMRTELNSCLIVQCAGNVMSSLWDPTSCARTTCRLQVNFYWNCIQQSLGMAYGASSTVFHPSFVMILVLVATLLFW